MDIFKYHPIIFIFCIVGFILIALTFIFILINSKKIKDEHESIKYRINRLDSVQKSNTDSVLKRIRETQSYLHSEIDSCKKDSLSAVNSFDGHIMSQLVSLNTLLNSIKKSIEEVDFQVRAAQSSIEKSSKQEILKTNKNINSTREDILSTIKSMTESMRKAQESVGQKQIEAIHNSENNIQQVLSKVQQNERSISDNIKILTVTWEKHLETLAPFDNTLSQLEQLYEKLMEQEKEFSKQESNINSLVERHIIISELTDKLNKTAKDVFELMRVYLMNSIVERTTPNKNETNIPNLVSYNSQI